MLYSVDRANVETCLGVKEHDDKNGQKHGKNSYSKDGHMQRVLRKTVFLNIFIKVNRC